MCPASKLCTRYWTNRRDKDRDRQSIYCILDDSNISRGIPVSSRMPWTFEPDHEQHSSADSWCSCCWEARRRPSTLYWRQASLACWIFICPVAAYWLACIVCLKIEAALTIQALVCCWSRAPYASCVAGVALPIFIQIFGQTDTITLIQNSCRITGATDFGTVSTR